MFAIRWIDVNDQRILTLHNSGGSGVERNEEARSWVGAVAQALSRWRIERARRRALVLILRRGNAHLLEDVGIDRCDATMGQADRDRGRNPFWIL